MKREMERYLVVVEQAVQLPMRSKLDMVARDFTVMAHSRTQAVNAVRKAGYSRVVKVVKEDERPRIRVKGRAPRLSR